MRVGGGGGGVCVWGCVCGVGVCVVVGWEGVGCVWQGRQVGRVGRGRCGGVCGRCVWLSA